MEIQIREKCKNCENGLIQNPQWQQFYETYGNEEIRKMSNEKYGFELTLSHASLIVKALDKKYPHD